MKYIGLILFFSLLNCSGQSKKCSNFKTGTFIYDIPEYKHNKIVRNDSIQIEHNSVTGIKITTSVNWISDCEYVLTYLDIENYAKKSELIGKRINVKILETSNNSYISHSTSATMDEEIKFIKID